MCRHGDVEWVHRKRELTQALWSSDYTVPLRQLRELLPLLTSFLSDAMLGDHRKVRLNNPNVPELRRTKYDHRFGLALEATLGQLLRTSNQKAPIMIAEMLGILYHTNNVTRSLEQLVLKCFRGDIINEKLVRETLSLMMGLRPAPLEGFRNARVVLVQMDNNHFRSQRGMEHLLEEGEKPEGFTIDTMTIIVFPIDEDKHSDLFEFVEADTHRLH